MGSLQVQFLSSSSVMVEVKKRISKGILFLQVFHEGFEWLDRSYVENKWFRDLGNGLVA